MTPAFHFLTEPVLHGTHLSFLQKVKQYISKKGAKREYSFSRRALFKLNSSIVTLVEEASTSARLFASEAAISALDAAT